MKRGGPLKRRKPLRPVSAKRLAEKPLRDEVRRITLARAGYRCQAPGLFGIVCGGGELEVHEIHSRGTTPGSHLDDTVTVALCPRHHRHVTDHPDDGYASGLRKHPWERRPNLAVSPDPADET
jgi:5-methylcytosine-specific restriction endonuclease McrA